MAKGKPSIVIATYRVKASGERAFRSHLRANWPTLRAAGLVTDEPPEVFRYEDHRGRPTYFEVFAWKSAAAAQSAHSHPSVAALWARMEECLENRDGGRKWEFPHVERVRLGGAGAAAPPSRRPGRRAARR